MRKITLCFCVLSALGAVACGGSQTRTDMAADRAIQVREERYEVVRARESEVEAARNAVSEAELAAIAAEEAETVLTSHSPAAVEAACDILAGTPAAPAPVEEVAEVVEVIEE